jgi:hypothetical protein
VDKEFRPTPNPNVLIELGYALNVLGQNKIILVMNSFFGGPELLPFDLKMRKTIPYYMAESNHDRALERNRLASSIEQALRAIFTEVDTILPDLRIEDNLIFKMLCDKVVENQDDLIWAVHLSEMSDHFEDKNVFNESLKILDSRKYISARWTGSGKIHDVRVNVL